MTIIEAHSRVFPTPVFSFVPFIFVSTREKEGHTHISSLTGQTGLDDTEVWSVHQLNCAWSPFSYYAGVWFTQKRKKDGEKPAAALFASA